MSRYPKVSVITSTLNCAATIVECLESITSQDYSNVEHIIVDGGSNDETLELVKPYGANIVSEKDAGIFDAFNKGIKRSSGEIIHILNADDHYKHKAVLSQMVAFMTAEQLDIGHARVEQIDHRDHLVRVIGYDVTHNKLLRKCKVAHPAVFARRSVYERFGNFSTGFRIAGDHEFFLRIWDQVNIGFLPEVVTVMRLGGVSNTQVSKSYRESMAAALLHGQSPVAAFVNYYYEMLKSKILQLKQRLPADE
jgi:glycosyltransferase involved in cell wall biosynthesis